MTFFIKLIEQTMPSGITRSVQLRPAYDTLVDGPNGSRGGIHNAEIAFIVSRGQVAVEWSFSTGWYLRQTRERAPRAAMRASGATYQQSPAPEGIGAITLHSPTPLYEGQEPSYDQCEYTKGPCYGGGAFLASTEVFDLVVQDPEKLWPELERRLEEIEKRVADEKLNARNYS